MQGCCIRAGGAIAAHCLGWQSEAPGQQHWRTTPCAVGNSCVLPTARLFCSTGERNGFTVLTEAEFYDFHLTTPDLSVMLMRVGAHALGMLAGQAKQAERLPSATFWLVGPTRPAQLPPAPCPLHHAPSMCRTRTTGASSPSAPACGRGARSCPCGALLPAWLSLRGLSQRTLWLSPLRCSQTAATVPAGGLQPRLPCLPAACTQAANLSLAPPSAAS